MGNLSAEATAGNSRLESIDPYDAAGHINVFAAAGASPLCMCLGVLLLTWQRLRRQHNL